MSFIPHWLSEFFAVLGEPASALFDPSKRLFSPFLVCSAALAVVTLSLRGVSLSRAARSIASPGVWFHRSALADYRLLGARMVLRALFVGARGLSTLAVMGLVLSFLRRSVGAVTLHASPVVVGLVFTLGVFVAEDLARFSVHRVMHRVPWLWAFHRVHHTAEVLTPLTLYRTHPVEAAINGASGALTAGSVTALCAWVFGPSLPAWEVLGVDALGFLWTITGANLRHSHVWLSYGPRVERWLLSPAQHQIHHSADARHADRNFGTALALWDALSGTLYVPRARESLRFGLAEPGGEDPHTLRAMLATPFVTVARGLFGLSPPGASSHLSTARVALLAASVLCAACTPESFNRTALLQSFGRCTLHTYGQFQTAADGLVTATNAWADAPSDATRGAARTAWERAIDVWERAELLRFGPAAGFDFPGGRGLREPIYAWPDVNRCLIEQNLVSRGYDGAGFESLPTSARGLGSLEYLLFYSGTDNACAADHPLNATGAWSALAPDELTRRKSAYARALATDLATRARALNAAWEPNGFLAQLTTAGTGSTLFSTQQIALSAVAEATSYLDTDVKTLRLAVPLGISNCPGATCPNALESPWADRGEQHLRNNLAGLRLLLEGCPAGNNLGFDDLLESAGAGALAAQMRNDLNAADAALNALPGDSLSAALATNRPAVLRVHNAIKEISDFLKMEFTATLQIRSSRVDGDND